MSKTTCEICDGTGSVAYLRNYECHYDGSEPDIAVDSCEECGGSGLIGEGHE